MFLWYLLIVNTIAFCIVVYGSATKRRRHTEEYFYKKNQKIAMMSAIIITLALGIPGYLPGTKIKK